MFPGSMRKSSKSRDPWCNNCIEYLNILCRCLIAQRLDNNTHEMLSLSLLIQNSSYDWLLLRGWSGILWWDWSAGSWHGGLRRREHWAWHAGKDDRLLSKCYSKWKETLTKNLKCSLFPFWNKIITALSRKCWELLQEKCINEAFFQRLRVFCVQLYSRKTTQKGVVTNPIFNRVILRCTVLVGMTCEIFIQTLKTLMMKFSYVSQLEGNSLRYKTQGRQQKPWLNFAKFLRWESRRGKKIPLMQIFSQTKGFKACIRKM